MGKFLNKGGFHLIALAILLVMTGIYFYPAFQGKVMQLDDIIRTKATSKELREYRESTGEEPLWTNSLFGGMPSFQMNTNYPTNLYKRMEPVTKLGLPSQIGLISALCFGFYFLLFFLGVDRRLSVVGALAFGFSVFFILSFEAGHTGKLRTMGYMAPALLSVIILYRRHLILGMSLSALFIGWSFAANHLQITYYTLLLISIFALVEGYFALRDKLLSKWIKKSLLLGAAILIGLGPNIANIWSTYTYAQETIRGGGSELTKEVKGEGGLDIEYAMRWSMGITETATLLIPDAAGGASGEHIREGSATYEALRRMGVPTRNLESMQLPMYFGKQPFVSGPMYLGAVVFFFFILSFFVLKGSMKWFGLIASILVLFLAWGKNFMFFNQLMFDYFPMYNKFRAPTMVIMVLELLAPLMGFLAISEIIKSEDRKQYWKAAKNALFVTGGIAAAFVLIGPSMLDLNGLNDAIYEQQGFPMDAILEDRASGVRSSAFRSLIFVGLSFGLLYLLIQERVKILHFTLGLGVLIVADLWPVNKRYVNEENFIIERAAAANYPLTQADQQILQDDSYYRVVNQISDPFTDAMTSYWHKNIGGYHAAKLWRYQDLIERQLSQGNMAAYNMLNTKYFIQRDQQSNGTVARRNPGALGNAWFINNLQWVPDADSEMEAINTFDPSVTAVVDARYRGATTKDVYEPQNSTVSLTEYRPNRMTYQTEVENGKQVIVFSEIYYEGYDNDWKVTIDGQPTTHFRVNYVLRAIEVPEGNHEIIFSFEPKPYFAGVQYSMIGSIISLLFILWGIWSWNKSKKEQEAA
jgi:hypothetical protein